MSDIHALTEDRPYRATMTKDKALGIIQSMVKNNSLDPFVVHLLTDNYDVVTQVIKAAQENAFRDFLSMGPVA
jgi:HD-GYP domain-containing protein (c-di-GMP phosphodiesterase class II)